MLFFFLQTPSFLVKIVPYAIIRAMKKKFLYIFILLLVIAVGIYYFVNAVLLPVHLKKFLIEKAEGYLGRNVSFEDISYNIKRGVIVNDLAIFQKASEKEKLLHADEISFSILISNIIKPKKIIINSLYIKNPVVRLNRTDKETWNFSDLLKKKTQAPPPAGIPSILLSSITINNATIAITDQTASPLQSLLFKKTDFEAKLSLTQGTKYSLKTTEKNGSSLKAEGTYHLRKKELESNIMTNDLDLLEITPLFCPNETFGLNRLFIDNAKIRLIYRPQTLDITGSMKSQIDYAFKKDKMIKATIESQDLLFYFDKNHIDLKASLLFDHFEGQMKDNKLASNSFLIKNGKLKKENGRIDFSGVLSLSEAVYEKGGNFLVKGDFKDAEMMLSYEGNQIAWTSSLETLNTYIFLNKNDPVYKEAEFNPINAKIDLKADIVDFKNPKTTISAKTDDIDIKILNSLFPQYLQKARIAPSGEAAVRVDYLSQSQKSQWNVKAKLLNASLDSDRLSERITNITGLVDYTDDLITWKNIKGTFKNETYFSDGSFVNSLIPSLTSTLKGKDIDISLDAKIQRNIISPLSLNGMYFDTSFDIRGNIYLPEGESPQLDIKGKMDLALENLPRLVSQTKDFMEKYKCQGILSTDFNFKGKYNDISKSNITVNAISPKMKILNYTLDNVSLKFDKGDKPYSQLDVKALAYNGNLDIISLFDFKNENLPFRTTLQIENLNLAKLIKDTPLKGKNIAGNFSAGLDLGGLLNNVDSIQGKGTMIIKDGYLWELNLLKGLFKFIIIPDFENVVFTEAFATVYIKDNHISTDDLALISNTIDLNGQGWIDFEKNIDLMIRPDVKETEIILAKPSVKKGPTTIFSQAQDYFNVRITGTLENPKFKMETLPQRILQDTTGVIKDVIIDGVGGIFDGILNQ